MVAFFTSRIRPSATPWRRRRSRPNGTLDSRRPSPATAGRGTSCGACATSASRATSASSSCSGSTSRTSCRSAPVTRPISMPACRTAYNGEAYRGHVFWDEIYVFPFLNIRLPDVSRGLLLYRYRRLGEARAAAHEAGFRGAMFPWQSGSEGVEETQRVHLNPLSGRWDRDLSHNQRHVNAAIFYNIWHYYQATGDVAFLRDYGAEVMLEIARFWASIAHFNPERAERCADPRRDGARRVPRTLPGGRRGRVAQQRLHERDGRVAGRCRPQPAVASPCEPRRGAAGEAGHHRRRAGDVGQHEPPDVRSVPRRRHHQSVRRVRRARGTGLGRVPGQVRQHPAPRSHLPRRGRRPRPLQARRSRRTR